MNEKRLAVVGYACGRHYLEIAGIVVAMEGDPSREALFTCHVWDAGTLREAAKIINEKGKSK